MNCMSEQLNRPLKTLLGYFLMAININHDDHNVNSTEKTVITKLIKQDVK